MLLMAMPWGIVLPANCTLAVCSTGGQVRVGAHSDTPFACLRAQAIQQLHLQENLLEGPLPESWAAPGRWPNLWWLDFWYNSLSGAVPPAWGNRDAFPALDIL